MIFTLLIASATVCTCGAVRRRLKKEIRRDRTLLGGRVRLTAFENRGAAFGLPIPRPALLLGSVAGLLAMLCHPARLWAGLVAGGGASNLAERLCRGQVFDYVQFPKAPGKGKRYIYNLADLAVFCGTLGLLCHRRPKRK